MEFPKAFRNERLLFLKKSRLLAALEKEITLKVINWNHKMLNRELIC